MKKALGFCFFNCVDEIHRSLGDIKDPKAICNNVDLIIGIEGKFQELEYPVNHSTDGSIEAFLKYPNTILYKLMATEIEKRNKYLEIAGKEGMDYVIVWDSDEYLFQDDWDTFNADLASKPNEDLLCLWGLMKPSWRKHGSQVVVPVWNIYPRIIKDPANTKYAKKHWQVYKKDASNYMTTDSIVDGIRFTMDSTLRDPKYMEAKIKYMNMNFERESLL